VTPPKPAAQPFDDRLLMCVGVVGFACAIPQLTGLYGGMSVSEPRFWLGFLGHLGLAASLWLGNRWLLFKQREHFDWFANPWRKLAMLVTANVLYTAPLTAAWLWTWFHIAPLPMDTTKILVVTLTNVICVVFVTHAYETVFLIRERESDLVRVEKLERSRAEAELAALKAQVDPHFLFNSLNTLGHLITRDPQRGRAFCDTLAEVYRYVLASRDRDVVPLGDELDFVRRYHRLLELRFGEAIAVEIDAALPPARFAIAPLALQTLVENAVKHNQLGDDAPLSVALTLEGDTVCVANRMLPRSSARPSSGLGLSNLDERCRLLTGRSLAVRSDGQRFEVRVPLVGAA
jgi:hypothetical protein